MALVKAWPNDPGGTGRERRAPPGALLDAIDDQKSPQDTEPVRPQQLAAIIIARRFGLAPVRARLVARLAGLAVLS